MNVSLKTTWRRVAAIACTLVVSVPLLQAATAAPASADDSCTGGVLCSATTNLSAFRVLVAKRRCAGDKPCEGSPTRWLSPGQSTPALEDWDLFRIDAGWCYSYNITPGGVPLRRYGERWVTVHNHERAYVIGQAKVPSWLCV